jgi:hypothetical protein
MGELYFFNIPDYNFKTTIYVRSKPPKYFEIGRDLNGGLL